MSEGVRACAIKSLVLVNYAVWVALVANTEVLHDVFNLNYFALYIFNYGLVLVTGNKRKHFVSADNDSVIMGVEIFSSLHHRVQRKMVSYLHLVSEGLRGLNCKAHVVLDVIENRDNAVELCRNDANVNGSCVWNQRG